MVIVNETYKPVISTIPDDTMIFAALDPSERMTKKIIAENYINFYAKKHPVVGDVIFRFENLINYESISGLKRVFIPEDYMKRTIANPDSLIDLLRDGYYINMPVSRKAIDFYVYEKDAHHHMLIYGVDIPNRQYLCKDYKEHEFISFETSFDSLMESSELYYNPSSTESNGILAFKIDDSIPHQINCSKILFEFTKLHFSKMVNDSRPPYSQRAAYPLC